MTATYDTTTDIGKIRLLISDTTIATAHFTDEELQVFLTMEGSVYLAAAVALESWAASLTETTISESIGDYSYTKKSADSKLALAERMRALDIGTPAMAWAEPNITNITADEEDL